MPQNNNVEVSQLRMGSRKTVAPKITTQKVNVNVFIEREMATQINVLVEKGMFKTRSEALREALKDLIKFYEWML